MDEIDEVLSGLSIFNDETINKTLEILFSDNKIMSDLDASGLCVLLINKKDSLSGRETVWFNMEQI